MSKVALNRTLLSTLAAAALFAGGCSTARQTTVDASALETVEAAQVTAADPASQAGQARVEPPAQEPTARFTYHHWPKVNVYLDINRDMFFWVENGERQSGQELPDELMNSLGGAVVVTLNSADPFAATEAENDDDLAQIDTL